MIKFYCHGCGEKMAKFKVKGGYNIYCPTCDRSRHMRKMGKKVKRLRA